MTLYFPIQAGDVERLERCPCCGDDRADCIATVELDRGPTLLTTDRCPACGLIFRRRRPTLDWFSRMWQRREAAQREAGEHPFNEAVERVRYDRYAATAQLLRRCGAAGRVIDIGCGPATGLRAYADAGFLAVGLEPDLSRARFVAVPGVTIVEQTVEDYAASTGERFDAVTCQHALEHFHDPAAALAAIAALAKPDGLAYLEVPDWRQDVRDWNDALYLAHQTNFTAETLPPFAARFGLQVVERVFPPADAPGATHLAYMFRKSSRQDVAQVDANAAAPSLAEVRATYCHGLIGTPPVDAPLRFIVPAINDLSMTLKGRPSEVQAIVRDNFAERVAEFDAAAGAYRVRGT